MICVKEDLCGLLRYLTSIELYENQKCYVFHPYVKEKSHVFKSENTLSDSALGEGYNRKNPSKREAVVNFQPKHFVPLVEFLAKGGSKTIQQLKITELFKRVCVEKVACAGMYLQ